jgi:dGTPase
MVTKERMQWEALLSVCRYGNDNCSKDGRSDFQRDIDRILFCDPFHRLARKTQVHPLNENDHIHSRLTHSLETSSVGRSLGERVGKALKKENELPDDAEPFHLGQIVQAACLAHDIGNPPFGHSGESAIKNWFRSNEDEIKHLSHKCQTDFLKLDGNAMAIRVLVSTGFYGEGMSPTFPVLGALIKYPWPSYFDAGKDKFSYFQTESDAIDQMIDRLGLIRMGERFSRHPLAYLTEAADDICYRIIDIEDATELGIVGDAFMLEAFGEAVGIIPDDAQEYERYRSMHFRQRNSIIRTKLIAVLCSEIAHAFEENYDGIMTGDFDHLQSLIEVSSGPVSRRVLDVYESIIPVLFFSKRKAILELGADNALGMLLGRIVREVGHLCTGKPSADKDKIKMILGRDLVDRIIREENDCAYRMMMASLDYITGMSDHYATEMSRKLFGLGF